MRRSPHPAALLVTLVATLLGPAFLCLPAGPAVAAPVRATTVTGWAAAPAGVDAGAPYVARLVVSGGSRAVALQRRLGTAWRTVDTARSRADGRVSLVWRAPRRAGRETLRVVVPRSGRSAATTTRARVVTVRATTPSGGGGGSSDLSAPLREVLDLVNRARSSPRRCGNERFAAVPPLRPDARLHRAADRYARLMGVRDFFDHTGPDGSDPGDRITAEGYRWASYGENIAAGYASAADVVEAWLASPGHCRNIMGPSTEIGLGHAVVPGSTYGTYWVQEFATPR